MNVSLGGFSFYGLLIDGTMDVFGYLETAKYRYGLDTVDLWNGFYEDRAEFVWKPADEPLVRKIKHALDERKLSVANVAVDRAHIWDPDPEMRAALRRNALAQLNAAARLGARTVRIDACYRGTDDMSEEAFAYTVETYREYAAIADAMGMKVGPENHMGVSLDAAWMKKLADAVGHPAYGILLHAGRWKEGTGGDADAVPYAYHVHADAKLLGAPDAAERIRAIVDAGYAGDWAVEYNPPSRPYSEIGWALASLRRLVEAAAEPTSMN
ncbi:sugar phosphate isomerase/epimerase family protein [Paenibacillus flagellatus]|uniref:Xylose isomerase n=1 Tax=Paenibacillus flagellatus TaxID=2211139 RepID=A0A2V5KKV8_9BACL|nr:TIM barrel protein [Paenibacillus flagellatus]PYI55470.1 xylose isomerase [Paenibacillus flagellatus]